LTSGRTRAGVAPPSANFQTRWVPSASTRIADTPASSGITVGEYSDSGVRVNWRICRVCSSRK
jgi:hypothetical protein